MKNIDFSYKADENSLLDNASSLIEIICSNLIIEKEAFNIIIDLNELKETLISSYFERNIKFPLYSTIDTAKIVFSQFLQYLFYYIQHHSDISSTYQNRRLLQILTNFKDFFYFTNVYKGKKNVELWINPNTGDTALTSISKTSEFELFARLIEYLKLAFEIDEDHSVQVLPELENYLFQENKYGESALTLLWKNKEKKNEIALLNLAKVYFGGENTIGYRKILFQIDNNGDSIINKAIANNNQKNIFLVFNAIKRIYGKENSKKWIRILLNQQNERGETAVFKGVKFNRYEILNLLIEEATIAFGGLITNDFRNFLIKSDQYGVSPQLLASKNGNRKLLGLLLCPNNVEVFSEIDDIWVQQDNQGYSMLMLAAEFGHKKCFRFLLNALWTIDSSPPQKLMNCLIIKNKNNHSTLQILFENNHWELLTDLIDTFDLFLHQIKTTIKTLDFYDDYGRNALAILYSEEKVYREKLKETQEIPKLVRDSEKAQSQARQKIARRLVALGFKPSKEETIPEEWQQNNDIFGNFFIFCGTRQNHKRSLLSTEVCQLKNKNLQSSITENISQLKKEAIINIMAYFTNSHQDSISQVAVIRNNRFISEHEKEELIRYDSEVERYYNEYGTLILEELKKDSSENLDKALTSTKAYTLVDSGTNLLVIDNKYRLFCSFLNTIEFIPLVPELTTAELDRWLKSYFNPHYTLHPFNPEQLNPYPPALENLEKSITSDSLLINRYYQGISGNALKSLFLNNNKEIDVSQLIQKNFIKNNQINFKWKIDKFHKVFFSLSIPEKESLQKLIIQNTFLPVEYNQLSQKKNEYLRILGANIRSIMIENSKENLIFNEIQFLESAISGHEQLLIQDTSLAIEDKQELISSLLKFKSNLSEKSQSDRKVALQFSLLLIPNVIRSVTSDNPFEVIIPLGIITSDTILRKIFIRLTQQLLFKNLFSENLVKHILPLVVDTSEKIPIIGSLILGYSLIKSGKFLLTTGLNNPNISYHAHILINDLSTLVAILATAASEFPYWPVLSFFSVLTFDQIINEGARIHDNVLHLKDDNNHPLLKFYSEIKLGLNIIDPDISIVINQRELFSNFKNYLNKVKNINGADALVAVCLPALKRVETNIPIALGAKRLGCINSPRIQNKKDIYPSQNFCTKVDHIVEKKTDYNFEIGSIDTRCELRDPFFIELIPSNYTLLASTSSPNCVLGKETTIDALVKAQGKSAAVLLVNTEYSSSNPMADYSIYIPIDPFYIRNFSLKLVRNKNTSILAIASNGLQHYLPCMHDTVFCLKTIRVVIVRLIQIDNNEDQSLTKISIQDDELRSELESQRGVELIEYLISISDKLIIATNQIPKQRFAFFGEDHYLMFSGENLTSDKGFHAALKDIKELTIELSEKTYVSGIFTPENKQKLIIKQLKSANSTKKAIVDITNCNEFTISLGKNTQIINKQFKLDIESNFTQPILDIYNYGENPFYRLSQTIHHCMVDKKSELKLFFNDEQTEESATIHLINNKIDDNDLSIILSGEYKIQNQRFFSRIIINKIANAWVVNLEINTAFLKESIDLYINKLKFNTFDKVSILTQHNAGFKKIYYLFDQASNFLSRKDTFVSYRLRGSQEGYILYLAHKKIDEINEETQVFLNEESNEISITNIRYLIKFAIARLYAIGTVDNTPIDGNQLIAPLRIDSNFEQASISHANNVYKIANLSFVNIDLNTNINFLDDVIPFYYIDYLLKKNQSHAILSPISPKHSHSEASHLGKSAKLVTLEPENNKHWLTITATSVGTMLAAALGLVCYPVIKRFRPSKHPSVEKGVITTLLSIKESNAHHAEKDNDTIYQLLENINQFNKSSNHYIAELDAKSSKFVTHQPADLNSQLLLANYFIDMFNHCKFNNSKNNYLDKSVLTENKFSFYNFYKQTAKNKSIDKRTPPTLVIANTRSPFKIY